MKYVLIALAVFAVLALVWFLVNQATQRRLEAQRVEAERLRAAADERQAALEGQRVFAEQARERAEQARADAEEQARAAALAQEQADNLAAEAGRYESVVSEGESDVVETLRQADDVDPDVDTRDGDTNDAAPVEVAASEIAPNDAASGEVVPNAVAPREVETEEPARSVTRESDELTDLPQRHVSSEDVAFGRGFGDPVGDEVADTSSGLNTPHTAQTADLFDTDETTKTAETTGAEAADAEPSFAPETQAWGRRISDLEEISDGGYGMGSAAPLSDGAQPLGHPVQAYRDTMTYRTEDAPGYDSAEPDVWFFDAEAAQRAGFQPAE